MEEHNPGVLTAEQQEEIEQINIKNALSNERYFRAHPELKEMVSVFVGEILEHKPENVLEFAGDFFTRGDLFAMVKQKSRSLDEALAPFQS
eukprot:GDKK01028935.1.p1 GENE.GDKK01028935.1~~GDKK01028935.1.p1  ORF type:complete len:100 (-),score=17.32 GDKK01028935.1:123-395(-)